MPSNAEAYLQPAEEAYWEWVDHGEAIRWREGPTIVIRQELAKLCDALVPPGLPPLDMLLLLLSACRHQWRGATEEITERLIRAHPHFTRRGGGRMWLGAVVRQLEKVNALPEECRTTTAAKLVLCETVFERHPVRLSPDESRHVVRILRGDRLPETVLTQRSELRPIGETTRHLMALCDAIPRIDAESLTLRSKTGLDRLVTVGDDKPPEEEPEPERLSVRQLLEVMENDPEPAGFAKLTRNLQAIVHLPRRVHEPEELPMGGLSDIANRGAFDRLLLSELANDSDTLMTRVALGEALYLRRERPPSNPPRQRIILLDSGIRMWGVPRVFAAAVALSLAAEGEDGDETLIFRADGENAVPVDVSTKETFIEHLSALDVHTHPGDALPRLLANASGDDCDLVIVSCAEAFGDPRFRRCLKDAEIEGCYLASVARDGRFELIAHSARGERTLKQAHFDLDALLAPVSRPTTPLVDDLRHHPLPAIFRLKRFPLRLAHNLDNSTQWSPVEETMLVVTSDRRLMHWTHAGLGAIQITDQLPGQRVRWRGKLGSPGEERFALVVEHASGGECSLVTEDSDADGVNIIPLRVPINGLQGFATDGGMLMVICRDRASLVDPATGLPFTTMELHDRPQWNHGRYFRGDGGWFALSLFGNKLVCELVVATPRPDSYQIVFYCEAAQEHVAVTSTGQVVFLDRQQRQPLPGTDHFEFVRVSEVADNGNWMLVELSHMHGYPVSIGVDVPSVGQAVHQSPGVLRGLVKQTNIRSQITSIGVVDDRLSLVTNKGRRLNLTRDQHSDRLVLSRGKTDMRNDCSDAESLEDRCLLAGGVTDAVELDDLSEKAIVASLRRPLTRLGTDAGGATLLRTLLKTPAPDGVGYRLKVCEWPDGSRAYVDSRGLLHLMSSDRSIPEVTLVLDDRHVSGWTSDGKYFGAPFYTGPHFYLNVADAAEIEATVLRPFVERIRLGSKSDTPLRMEGERR